MARAASRASRRGAVALDAIRLLVLDVDGVLTDGRLVYGARGEELKIFHVRDGHGIKLLQQAGVAVAVLSGRRSLATARRCRELGIRHVAQGLHDKTAAFDLLLRKLKLDAREVACVGDDTPDIALLARAGLAVAVADAHPLVLAVAHRRTTLPGGRGAVREICDWLLAGRAAP
jgi:3-deoxy-D-manno-octulosonate 8-phosphate phosphatase (KDO 8-P phosphatase)